MRQDRELPHSSIDDGLIAPERDGETDSARLADWRLRSENSAPPRAGEDCRLAEALFHAGREAEAIARCRRALPEIADDAASLRICAWVFSNAGCNTEAANAYRRLLAVEPEWGEGWRHLAAALAAVGHVDEAIAAAQRALALQPGDDEAAIAVAELMMRASRNNEAAQLLAWVADSGAGAQLWRVLSAAEMLCGHLPAALAAIDGALAQAPENAEYHTHRGHLLWQTGDLAGAAQALDRAAILAPENSEARRAQLSLLLSAGLVSEATAVGGDLLHRFPDDKPAAAAVLHLLSHRLDTIDGDYVTLATGIERPARLRRTPPGWRERLRRQGRVIAALIIRETRTRFADLRLGYAWALIEPILHIALLSVMFAVLMRGRPPIGKHFFIFYYTGLIPYLMFVHTSSGMSHAITGNRPVLQLPPVTIFDVVAARGLLEVMTDVLVAVILLAGFGAIGVAALPDDLWEPAIALLVIAGCGCGIGFVNAVLTAFWRSWDKAYNQLTRVLYFASGIFYVPAMMPDWARDALAWNPVLQAIDWFRAGFFAGYRPHWLDRSYLTILAILTLLLGFVLERGLRRRLSALP